MAPLDTNRFVTLWVPMQPVLALEDGGSGLTYAGRSHRDVALKFWELDDRDVAYRYEFASHGAMELGDVSAHHGWCLHGAPGITDEECEGRLAFTVSYFVDGCHVLPDLSKPHGEDNESYASWVAE
eukprot:gene12979-15341_t